MGRHVGSSVHAVSYIIYIALNLYLALRLSMCRPADLPTCLPSSKRKYNIYIEAMYITDDRWVSGSAIALSVCPPADLPTRRHANQPLTLNIIYA